MKQIFKLINLLSAVLIILSALVIPAFAEDPPTSDGDDEGTIIGEMEMVSIEDVLGEGGEPQTSDTDLQTYVPARVTLDIGQNGSVKHNKKVYSKNTNLETMTLIFYIMPKKGYQIDSVYWNGKDVTKLVSNGLLKIKDLEDGILKVRFKMTGKDNHENEYEKKEKQSEAPKKEIHHVQTSDETKNKAFIYISVMVLCLISIVLTFIKNKKMNYLRKK